MTNKHFIPALDGLRALAIFFVLARHASLLLLTLNDNKPILTVYDYDLFTFFLNGWIGVDLFFVLSGYLIASQFFKETPPTLSKYALRRILRIVPAYYAVLTLCALGAFPFYEIPAGEHVWRSYFLHLFFLQDYTGSDINSNFWSLAVEEKFYILMPAIVAIILYFKRKLGEASVIILLLSIMALGIVLRITVFSMDYSDISQDELKLLYKNNYRHPAHCCIEAFMFGILIAFLKFRSSSDFIFNQYAKIIFLAGSLILMALMIPYPMLSEMSWFDLSLQPTLVCFPMFLIVLGTVFGGAPKFFQSRFMRWGSTMSYSFYLVHTPLIPFSAFITFTLVETWKITAWLPVIIIFLTCFSILVLSVSSLIHWFIEKPALKIKDRI